MKPIHGLSHTQLNILKACDTNIIGFSITRRFTICP